MLSMPLELHYELFARLPLHSQLRLIPTLCRGIYSVMVKRVKRKLESINKWQLWNKSYIDMSSSDRTIKHQKDVTTIRARDPVPTTMPGSSMLMMHGGIHVCCCYFEVTIVKAIAGLILIGLCDSKFPLSYELIGNSANSFAMDSDGDFWAGENIESNAGFVFHQPDDVVGCGVGVVQKDGNANAADQKHYSLFFTKNGQLCDKQIPLPSLNADASTSQQLFPAVSLSRQSNDISEIEANFGHKPFKYNLVDK